LQNFNFHLPATVADAVALLKQGYGSKLLAGGQSLLPLMKLDMAAPDDLISLQKVTGLQGISRDGDNLVIGAGTTHAGVARSAEVLGAIPGLAKLASQIGDPQVRNRGTLGGSLAHADPASDYPGAMLGLGATVHTDRRTIAADEFFTGLFSTALESDEVITRVSFPVPDKAAYVKYPHPASLYPVVGVFVAVFGGSVRLAVTGTADKVFRLPDFESALAASFDAKSLDGLSVPQNNLIEDPEFDLDYRTHLVTVIAKRAVRAV
jgi:carbon-monoxide dehydrogenase medium subunit